MTQRNSAKGKKRRKKPEKLEFVQDFIPIKELRHGIIETTDGRYIKILEIEPINFMLRSDDEQFSIISTFASWLKISPIKLQFKSITRRADSDKHVAMVREELEAEPSEECKHLGEDYINLIKDVGSREALTRRFFLIFQYEEIRRNETDDFSQIYNMMQTKQLQKFSICSSTVVPVSTSRFQAAWSVWSWIRWQQKIKLSVLMKYRISALLTLLLQEVLT